MKRVMILLMAVLVVAAFDEASFAAAKELTVPSPDGIPLSYTVQGKGEPAIAVNAPVAVLMV